MTTIPAQDICSICLDPVRVPVELTCFPCSTSKTIKNCYSINRICLHCARKYLHLNEIKHKRPESIKCLFCPDTVDPRTLNAETSYKKDYRMMACDPHTYTCVHDSQCGFRGSQMQLERHLQQECNYRMCFCMDCKCRFKANSFHDTTCPARFTCTRCHQRVLRTEYTKHFREEHHVQRCQYCGSTFDLDHLEDHKKTCVYRFIECDICGESKQKIMMYSHLLKHRTDFQKMIQTIEDQIKRDAL